MEAAPEGRGLSFVHKLRRTNPEWAVLGVACERHPGGNGDSGTHCRAVLRFVNGTRAPYPDTAEGVKTGNPDCLSETAETAL